MCKLLATVINTLSQLHAILLHGCLCCCMQLTCQQHNVQTACHSHQHSESTTCYLLLHAINIALIAPSNCQQHNVQTACHSHQHSESTTCYFAAWVSPPCAQAAGLTAKVHVVTSQQHPTSLCMTLLHVPCLATCGAHMSWQNVTLLTLPTTSLLHLLSAQIIQISTASEAKWASRH